MSSTDVSKLPAQELAELACTYASLILHDDGQDITADKIAKLINASGVKVEPYWPGLFAKALQGQNISSFFNLSGQSAPQAPVAAQSKPTPAVEKKEQTKKAGKKEQPKKAPQPVVDDDEGGMGGLFD